MPEWRPVKLSICRSSGLSKASAHVALFYTWGILQADAHGVMRREEAKALIFPNRSSEAKVQAAIDWLIEHGKLCQHEHRGRRFIHWCWFDLHQPAGAKKGRGAPAFIFTCPNERRVIDRDPESDSTTLHDTPRHSRRLAPRSEEIRRDQKRLEQLPPTPSNDGPLPLSSPSEKTTRDPLMEAVIAIWPGAGATFYQGYTELEEEYGANFMWECWRAALKAANTKPSVGYLEKIARRCKAEGKQPGQREDLRDEPEPDNRPTEVEGHPVIGWGAGLPILDFDAPAQGS